MTTVNALLYQLRRDGLGAFEHPNSAPSGGPSSNNMARTFVQPGNTTDAIAPGPDGVVTGVPLLIGSLFGIPEVTPAAGESFALSKAAHALKPGGLAYWASGNGNVIGTAATNYKIGVTVEHANADDPDVLVRLEGVTTAQESAG
jgi:predicted RecA/RadA family phage recombinase